MVDEEREGGEGKEKAKAKRAERRRLKIDDTAKSEEKGETTSKSLRNNCATTTSLSVQRPGLSGGSTGMRKGAKK
jgi:hypothetical protein